MEEIHDACQVETPEEKKARTRANRQAGVKKAREKLALKRKRGPMSAREEMRAAVMWAVDHEPGGKGTNRPPSVMAKRMMLLAEENPASFMRNVFLPLVPPEPEKVEEDEESKEKRVAGNYLEMVRELLAQLRRDKNVE